MRQFLDKEPRRTICISYIHFYVNYANFGLASKYFPKLKTIHYQQKTWAENYLRWRYFNPIQTTLFTKQIYINMLTLGTGFKTFNTVFEQSTHKYPTQFSEADLTYKNCSLTNTKYLIFVRGPRIWNESLSKEEK